MTDDHFPPGQPIETLSNRSFEAKREYVEDLERRADPQAIALLVECLCDESGYLRDLAEQAFTRLGGTGVAALLPLLDQGLWYTRTSAARVLGRQGYRPAVPALIRLTDDGNETVARAAQEALAGIARERGALRVAHALHRLAPDLRRRRLAEIQERSAPLAERVEHFMRNAELMGVEDPDPLADDSPTVRAADEGVEWEVLTGPLPPKPSAGDPGGGHAGSASD
ncbi:MAG: hypothetical protein A2W00_14805 [Candidatus Eisenbacteria bacterium RBG_16_71_46]|nr:MAG: hypothetical protein A2W00_14805 [Candidatus Eisenbacteria bacterium RBG_16_71_46]